MSQFKNPDVALAQALKSGQVNAGLVAALAAWYAALTGEDRVFGKNWLASQGPTGTRLASAFWSEQIRGGADFVSAGKRALNVR